MDVIDLITQVAIFVLGVGAIVLIARKNKWGFVVGLCSQPFWFISTIRSEQWGIFALAVVYLFTWIYGIYEWFYKEEKVKS